MEKERSHNPRTVNSVSIRGRSVRLMNEHFEWANSSLNAAFRFYLDTSDHDLTLNYCGPFLDDITARLVDITENSQTDPKKLNKVNRKVSFLLVECFQNIIKHGESMRKAGDDSYSPGMFSLRKKDGAYIINSINPVRSEEVLYLKKTVDLVNTMDQEALKHMYKRQLEKSQWTEKGGAGLGLIELARRSGQKLIYEFEDMDLLHQLFHQQIMFLEDSMNVAIPNYIVNTKTSFNSMGENKILLQYKGDFSQRSILPLLHIVENNLLHPESGAFGYKKVGHVLIEVLQNISKHGQTENDTKGGVFMIGQQDGHTYLVAGNVMKHANQSELESKLSEICELDATELKDLHRRTMLECVFRTDTNNAGLGIIEIAKASQGDIAYDFRQLDEERSFFSLFVSV